MAQLENKFVSDIMQSTDPGTAVFHPFTVSKLGLTTQSPLPSLLLHRGRTFVGHAFESRLRTCRNVLECYVSET